MQIVTALVVGETSYTSAAIISGGTSSTGGPWLPPARYGPCRGARRWCRRSSAAAGTPAARRRPRTARLLVGGKPAEARHLERVLGGAAKPADRPRDRLWNQVHFDPAHVPACGTGIPRRRVRYARHRCNLASILTDSAARDGDHVALKLDDAELTYAALDGASAHVAGLLAEQGVSPGDRVGIMLPNVPYFPVVYYGVLRAGAVVVPMNVLLKRREVAFYLQDSGAKLLFAWHGFAEDAQAGADDAGAECIIVAPGEFEQMVGAAAAQPEVVARNDSETAVILYTSGTTGTPKGAELTHSNLLRNAEVARDLFSAGTEAVTLGALPLFHSFGQTCSMNAIASPAGR